MDGACIDNNAIAQDREMDEHSRHEIAQCRFFQASGGKSGALDRFVMLPRPASDNGDVLWLSS